MWLSKPNKYARKKYTISFSTLRSSMFLVHHIPTLTKMVDYFPVVKHDTGTAAIFGFGDFSASLYLYYKHPSCKRSSGSGKVIKLIIRLFIYIYIYIHTHTRTHTHMYIPISKSIYIYKSIYLSNLI